MIENNQLLELVGKTKTQKLLDEITSEFQETFMKKYPDYSKYYPTKANSIVTVTEENEIKKIGMSCLNDLFSDQWALILGLIFSNGGDNNVIPKNSFGNHNFRFAGLGLNDQFNATNKVTQGGGSTDIGSGLTPPTRLDTQIQTLKTNIQNASAGYNSGLGKISCPAQTANILTYDLSETALYLQCFLLSPIFENAQMLISHDLISPVVPVTNGETINIDYSLLI